MISNRPFSSAAATFFLALGVSAPAAGAPLVGSVGAFPSPVATASAGQGIVFLVHETTEPAAAPFGQTLGFAIETREIVRTRLTEFELATALGLRAAEVHASFEPIAGKLATRLASFGTSSVYTPTMERGFTWRVLPSECVLFLEVTMGIMALGFLPHTIRRAY